MVIGLRGMIKTEEFDHNRRASPLKTPVKRQRYSAEDLRGAAASLALEGLIIVTAETRVKRWPS